MPKESYPYKVVRCRYFDRDGKALYPFCSNGSSCKFLHPLDNGWPGGNPKPSQDLRKTGSPSSKRDYWQHCPRGSRSRSPDRSSRRRPHSERSPSYDDERSPLHSSRGYSKRDYSPTRVRKSSRYDYDDDWYSLSDEPRSGYMDTGGHIPLSGPNNVNVVERGRWGGTQRAGTHVLNGNVDELGDVDMMNRNNDHEDIASDQLDTQMHSSGVAGYNLHSGNATHGSNHNDVQLGIALMSRDNNVEVDSLIASLPATSFAQSSSKSTITKLISELTKVHLRLLDNRKIYNDESLKLEAFESLATQFDIPHILTSSLLGSHATDSSSGSLASDIISSMGSSGGSDASSAPEKVLDPRKRRMLANAAQTSAATGSQEVPKEAHPYNAIVSPDKSINGLDQLSPNGSPSKANYPGHQLGPQNVHQALLDTLTAVRQKQKKVAKRVEEDYQEMADILGKIWESTIEAGLTNPALKRHAEMPSTPVKEPKHSSSTSMRTKDKSSDHHSNPSHRTSPNHSVHSKGRSVSKRDSEHNGGAATSVDSSGKVLKKMRRVSFYDELGASEREKEMLRYLEEKIAGLERKMMRFAVVEKENVKMKAELKVQKETLETIKSTVEEQKGIIAGLTGSPTEPQTTESESANKLRSEPEV